MLRSLQKTDLEAVLNIEKMVHLLPWTRETFETCFRSGYIGWVVELEQQVVGFIIVSLTAVECHILNLCVMTSHQRQGWGKKLLHYALVEAQERRAGIAYLEVRRSNTPAISLYEKIGFHLVGERKNYYPAPHGQEDALVFARNLVVNRQ